MKAKSPFKIKKKGDFTFIPNKVLQIGDSFNFVNNS
jgi:hypothetical protein